TTMPVITPWIAVHSQYASCSHFSVQSRSPSARRGARRDLDAVEQRFERRVVALHVRRTVCRGFRRAEHPPVQTLVEDAHAAPVEKQDLECVAAATVEDEECSASSVVADL